MNRIGNILLAILAVIWLAGQFVFVVFEFDKAVMLKFGKLVKSDIKPGLHVRIPFVDEVRRGGAVIPLRAMVTPTSRSWTLAALLAELNREHEHVGGQA